MISGEIAVAIILFPQGQNVNNLHHTTLHVLRLTVTSMARNG